MVRNFGLSLIAAGLVLFLVALVGAARDQRRLRRAASDAFDPLKWLMKQLKKPIENLTKRGLKWYRRVVALGEICLVVGLFLTVLG